MFLLRCGVAQIWAIMNDKPQTNTDTLTQEGTQDARRRTETWS